MLFIRFMVSKRCTLLMSTIILLGVIMPSYSCCIKKKLLYIVIIDLFNRQPFFYMECTKSNIRLFYDI